jgi:hypothetical protein
VAHGRKHGGFETGEFKEGKHNSSPDTLLTPYDEIPKPSLRLMLSHSCVCPWCLYLSILFVMSMP